MNKSPISSMSLLDSALFINSAAIYQPSLPPPRFVDLLGETPQDFSRAENIFSESSSSSSTCRIEESSSSSALLGSEGGGDTNGSALYNETDASRSMVRCHVVANAAFCGAC